MNAPEKFSRARLATIVVGTGMLRCVFEKRRNDICFKTTLKEKLKMENFNPSAMNFMQLYALCAKNVVEELCPSEGWEKDRTDSRYNSLGDDIKKLKRLLESFHKTESYFLFFINEYNDVCKTLNDIIKRFLISEGVDFARNFQYIMFQCVADEINEDFNIIFDKGITDYIQQKYNIASVKPKCCQSPENKENSCQKYRVSYTAQERLPKNTTFSNSSGPTSFFPDSDSNWWKHMSAMREAKSKGISTAIKYEGERKVDSLPERKVRSFTYRQIYFDFVPPLLNYFEYTMNELSSIEQSLHRIVEPQYSEPTVSDYMSFTFVYVDHMDLTNASLALFDAEPEEKDDADNKSRIVVVYLDKEMTFEMLKEVTSNRTLSVTSGEDVYLCLAGHSEHLLQDRAKLQRIMATFLGKRPEVLNADNDMKRLYDRFNRLSRQMLRKVQNLYQNVVEVYGNEKRNVEVLAKRLSKLRQMNNPNKIKGIGEISLETKENISSLRDEGLMGYTMENDTLVLCFKSSSNKFSEEMIPNNIKKKFPKTKIIYLRKLYSLHNKITSGEKLHPFRDKPGSYGTVGMIGSFRSETGVTSTMCCISSPHVISADGTAFFRDATVLLGTCIWPPAVPEYHINVEDISVIPLEKNVQICRRQPGEIKLFDEVDRHKLDKRKVFKFGATTGKTLGFVCKTDFILELGKPPINVFLIEPYDKSDEESRFSKPGDSGAVVLTKFGKRVEAFSMIFAGDVNIPDVAKNNTIAVELKHAVEKFENSHCKILELNTL